MHAIISLLVGASLTSAIQLWSAPADIPASVPAKCRSVLVQNITCDELVLPNPAVEGQSFPGEGAKSICSNTCRSSLDGFRQKVTASCGHTLYTLNINSTIPRSAQAIAEGLMWANNLMCIQDQSGYCLAAFRAGNKTACSDCALKYGSVMVSSDYGRVKYPEKEFKSVLSSCSVPTSSYTYNYTTQPPTSALPTTSAAPTAAPCTGKLHAVASGDTCKSISDKNSIAIDRMIQANNLDRNCSSLVQGRQLCLSDPCTLATVQKNQTCNDIVRGKDFTKIQLQAWNPILDSMCDVKVTPNLDALSGRSICISPPGGGKFNGPTTTAPTATWTPTMFNGSWREGVVATTRVAPVNMSGIYDRSYNYTTITATYNPQQADAYAERRKYCWITQEDMDNAYSPEDYVPACQGLYETYCVPDMQAPSPTSPKIPAQCTPYRTSTSASTASTTG